MHMTLAMRYLGEQLEILESLGFERAAALEALGITQAQSRDPLARISVARLANLYTAAEKALSDPQIGLRTGHKFRIGTYAQTGSLYGYCENLAQVIDFNSRYQRLAIDFGQVEHETSEATQTMAFYPHEAYGPEYRHVFDMIMGAYATAYRWLSWGSGQDFVSASLVYPAPADLTLHEQVFQCPLKFNQTAGRIEFSNAAMSAPITTRDAEKCNRARAKLDALLGAADAGQSFEAALRGAIHAAMENGAVNTDIVAARLGRNWRDVRKDMRAQGLTFRALLDGVRQTQFQALHEKGESFSAIAQQLCYNDQAAFSRAFKRWYGVAPGQWKGEPPTG